MHWVRRLKLYITPLTSDETPTSYREGLLMPFGWNALADEGTSNATATVPMQQYGAQLQSSNDLLLNLTR